jgi:V/A-type H+-transporting ATPase subunit I
MGIARVLKATVIGYGPDMDDVLDAVQRSGVLEVSTQPYQLETAALEPESDERITIDEEVAEAIFVRDFLGRYHTNEMPLSTFITEKIHMDPHHFHRMHYTTRMRGTYRQCVRISDRLAAAERETERLTALIADLAPWQELRLEIERWCGTERTHLLTGTVPSATGPATRAYLREQVSEVTVQELGPTGDRQAWVVIAMTDSIQEVRTILAGRDFVEIGFPGLTSYPAEEAARARDRISKMAQDTEKLIERAHKLSQEHYVESVALVQAMESRRDSALVRGDIGRTHSAFVVTGWVPEKQVDALTHALVAHRDSVDVDLCEPTDEDDPPVLLENAAWLKPFEVLTDLYGRPGYRGSDPTPLLAPFFLLFFSLCIGDVGYGAMLVVGAWLVKHRLDVTTGVKRFMDLLITGGFGSMVIGVLLGSYVALPEEMLPSVLRSLKVLDPVADIQPFLLIALAIGAVQVFFGVLVAAYQSVRRGDVEGAVFDHLSIIGLFAALTVTAVAGVMGNSELVRASLVIGIVGTMIMQGRVVQAAISSDDVIGLDRVLGIGWASLLVLGVVGYGVSGYLPVLWTILGVSAAGLVVSRAVRRGVVAVLLGAYNVYGLTGFVSDVLSYMRLPALGLSGTLVGLVFNILTGLVWSVATPLFAKGGLSPVFGVIIAMLAVLLFAVGHVFNVVINLLGAFVHPARLQFVEFFTKFYEAGGRPFSPFGFRTDGLVLDAGAAGEKGGKVS